MINLKHFQEELKEIEKRLIEGEISLLEFELVPIFSRLNALISPENLEPTLDLFQEACSILHQKFQEFKFILESMDSPHKLMEYLKQEPSEAEILSLIRECWIEPFFMSSLSLDFLMESKKKLEKKTRESKSFEELQMRIKKENFTLEISEVSFADKMNVYYNKIIKKLPCSFEDIFENEHDQITIYEHFVYLLHLLQLGKIKYQKPTRMLYT
ncbi:MAG: hypothetical protein ACTSU4_06815 [Promethearchaeota archaeon]